MIATLTHILALMLARGQGQLWSRLELPVPAKSPVKLFIQTASDPMDPPIKSPKRFGEDKVQWEFPWISAAYGHIDGDPSNSDNRFRIFSQEQKGGKSAMVARMLLRLWDMNVERLRLGHNPEFHRGLVDVYLCYGGKAGGEQLFDQEFEPDPKNPGKTIAWKANTIYIYDLPSFTDPVEMAREVAHEYGHATWAPIGGFQQPEEWANGYLAEKVFLRWMRDAIARGDLTPDDAMGATKEGLDKWLAVNFDPLMLKAAQQLPTPALLSDKSEAGMNAYLGLALYIETLFPDRVFKRSMELCGLEAKGYPESILLAADEPDEVTLKVPDKYFGHLIWLPVGKGKVTGAKIIKFDPSGWVQVEVRNAPITIKNYRG